MEDQWNINVINGGSMIGKSIVRFTEGRRSVHWPRGLGSRPGWVNML